MNHNRSDEIPEVKRHPPAIAHLARPSTQQAYFGKVVQPHTLAASGHQNVCITLTALDLPVTLETGSFRVVWEILDFGEPALDIGFVKL